MVDEHKLVQKSGKHTADVEQHELTMHTDVSDEHLPVELHGSRSEHRAPGAQ